MTVEQALAHPEPVSTGVHTSERVVRWGWVWPRWSDPRIPFAAILTLYGVLGFSFFGFNRSPAQMASIVVLGSALDAGLGWLLRREKVVPLSGYISCCSLALLLNYSHRRWLLLLAGVADHRLQVRAHVRGPARVQPVDVRRGHLAAASRTS